MDILLYLIPIALTLGLLGLAAFLWTFKNNQYDDLEGAAHRILIDDDFYDEENKNHHSGGEIGDKRIHEKTVKNQKKP